PRVRAAVSHNLRSRACGRADNGPASRTEAREAGWYVAELRRLLLDPGLRERQEAGGAGLLALGGEAHIAGDGHVSDADRCRSAGADDGVEVPLRRTELVVAAVAHLVLGDIPPDQLDHVVTGVSYHA